jgi:protein CpxP
MTRNGLTTMAAAAAMAVLPWVATARAQEPSAPPAHEREFGHGPGGFGGPAGPGMGRHLEEALGLSDDQKTQVEAIHTRQRETMKPLMDAVRQAHDAFRQAMDAANPDAAAVGSAALALHAAEKKLQAAQEATLAEIKAILTPEQRDKLDKMRENGPGFGPGRPHGPRPAPQS